MIFQKLNLINMKKSTSNILQKNMLHFKTKNEKKTFFLRKRCLASISISILCFFTPLSHY